MAVGEGELDSNGGISTAGVDYLRATASGVARLARALAQGEVRGGRYCGGDVSFAFDVDVGAEEFDIRGYDWKSRMYPGVRRRTSAGLLT